MIKEEKIRMMTQVAMIQKREERRAIEICGYRKKDYVSIQMIKYGFAIQWPICCLHL